MENTNVQADALLECRGLVKRFSQVTALDGVELTLGRGKIIGLLGPNGAGKTTLLKMAEGLLQPDAGEIKVCGQAPGWQTKAMVSYLPDCMYFADWMTVGDITDMFKDFFTDFDHVKSDEMSRTLGLVRSQRIKSLSKGTKEKMQLMLAMSRNAELYLLDEPIAGVDPAAREFILKTILTNYNEKGSVLISTHLILDVEQVLDEAVFMNHGKIVLHESVDDIREQNEKSVDEMFRQMFRLDPFGEVR